MKSQMSIEFLTGVVILLLIYVVTISVFSNYIQTGIIPAERGKQICYRITNDVNSALIGGSGFTINSSIPYTINGDEYFAFINPLNSSLLTIDWGDSQFSCSMNTQEVSIIFFKPCDFSVNNVDENIILSTVSSDKLEYEVGENVEIYGGVYLTNVNLLILNEDNEVLKNETLDLKNISFGEIESDKGFRYNWTAEEEGKINIIASDIEYKNLYAERIIYIS